jgi:hypothetical protein
MKINSGGLVKNTPQLPSAKNPQVVPLASADHMARSQSIRRNQATYIKPVDPAMISVQKQKLYGETFVNPNKCWRLARSTLNPRQIKMARKNTPQNVQIMLSVHS